MRDLYIDEAKKKLSADALARAVMARAEAAGQSVTEWLADEEHAAELRQQAEVRAAEAVVVRIKNLAGE